MGIPGLWEVLKPSRSISSLTKLALPSLPFPSWGFRLGIDVSIWLFHAGYSKAGENPELCLIFFRCCSLLKYPILPIFIFDGCKRPKWKRGEKVNRSPAKLVTAVKAVIEAFGFEWQTAPGEAEAELVYLNEAGIIDGILTDDVDAFVFGAHTVIRNPSSTHPQDKKLKHHVHIYSQIPQSHADLIFIALCSGGDYHTGLQGCGVKTALALAKCGFADSLYTVATSLSSISLPGFLDQWCGEVISELASDSHGCIGWRMTNLVSMVPRNFPDIDILLSYVQPVTSLSEGRPDFYADLAWTEKEPSIPDIAHICEFYFEWGFKETILKQFRNLLFAGKESVPMEDRDWIAKIHSKRKHFSTDDMLEYRIEIRPSLFAHLAEKGVQGICRRDDLEWEELDTIDDGKEDKAADPCSPLCMWVLALLVEDSMPALVDEYVNGVQQREKKRTRHPMQQKSHTKVTQFDLFCIIFILDIS
ncbi:PIN domain-like protein [Armillaria nabsnona]|nr:PIN domain-like protein [Armillaria nabsnona]